MSPSPSRNKILMSLYLEPHAAEQLRELSGETRIAQSVLLREAVDDLLYRSGKSAHSPTFIHIRKALQMARDQLAAYRREIVERKRGIIPLQACDAAIDRVDNARAMIIADHPK